MSEECKYCKTSQTCLEMADYGSFYCLLHREIPRVIEKTYEELQQENQELKEQLSNSHQIEVQQKEFIKWLEKETKIIENKLNKYNELVKQGKETDIEYYLSIIDERIFDIYGKILSKYKEIIGCKE